MPNSRQLTVDVSDDVIALSRGNEKRFSVSQHLLFGDLVPRVEEVTFGFGHTGLQAFVLSGPAPNERTVAGATDVGHADGNIEKWVAEVGRYAQSLQESLRVLLCPESQTTVAPPVTPMQSTPAGKGSSRGPRLKIVPPTTAIAESAPLPTSLPAVPETRPDASPTTVEAPSADAPPSPSKMSPSLPTPPASTVTPPATPANPTASLADNPALQGPLGPLERIVWLATDARDLRSLLSCLNSEGACAEAAAVVDDWLAWFLDKGLPLKQMSATEVATRLEVGHRALDYFLFASPDKIHPMCDDGMTPSLSATARTKLVKMLGDLQAEVISLLRDKGIERMVAPEGSCLIPGMVDMSELGTVPTKNPRLHDKVAHVEPGEGGYRAGKTVLVRCYARCYSIG